MGWEAVWVMTNATIPKGILKKKKKKQFQRNATYVQNCSECLSSDVEQPQATQSLAKIQT